MNFPSEHGRVFPHQQAAQGTILVAMVPCVGKATTDVTTTEVINVVLMERLARGETSLCGYSSSYVFYLHEVG